MSINPAQATWLDQLATNALDALRDQDRRAVQVATYQDSDKAKALHRMAVERAQRAELALFDAIHSLVVHQAAPGVPGRPRRRLRAFLGQ